MVCHGCMNENLTLHTKLPHKNLELRLFIYTHRPGEVETGDTLMFTSQVVYWAQDSERETAF